MGATCSPSNVQPTRGRIRPHLSTKVHLVPRFRSSSSIAASSNTNVGTKGTSKYMIPVALFDLKFLHAFAAGDLKTSNRRHSALNIGSGGPCMDLGLAGRRVLITGGSQGIGYAVAESFLAEGCHVMIVARDQARLDKAAGKLSAANPGRVQAKSIDLAQHGAAETLAATYPETDILVNNAGAIPIGDILEVDEARWRG